MRKAVLIGAGGHALSVFDTVSSQNEYSIVGCITEDISMNKLPIPIIGNDDTLEKIYSDGIKCAIMALGNMGGLGSNRRWDLYLKLKKIGFDIPIIVDRTAIISDDVKIGEGTFIGKGVSINRGAVIGNASILNTRSVIEHETKIENNVHVAVGAIICGGCYVGAGTLIGAGAVMIQNTRVGNNSVVGAGAVVVKNVMDRCLALGLPAKTEKIKE